MIPEKTLSLLEPLERFETIRSRAVRFGDRLCDLSYANPYHGVQEGAREALEAALREDRTLGFQYAPFGGHTVPRRLVADALRRSHDLPFAYRDVILTPGAMSALQIALWAAGRGAEVIVPAPCWLDVPVYVHHVGATPVMVPPDRDARIDPDAVAAAITERTRAVVMAHPANPTGQRYDGAEAAALGSAIAARERALGIEITLIADETHRDFTSPGAYHSLADHTARAVIVYSFGKYHFMQGQRLGYAAVSPNHPARAALSRELERWTRIAGVATPTALMQRAIPKLLELRYDVTRLLGLRQWVARRLRGAGFEVAPGDATLFVYAKAPAGISDWAFTERLAARGLLVLPAPVFHHEGWFRLALTASEPMLERALDVLEEEVIACPT